MNTAKYMDDATLQESIDLTSALATKLDRSGPLPWWESSGKLLPNENTLLQTAIETMKTISDDREMILNPDKTKLMIVNFSSNHFQSLLHIPGSLQKIDRCFETKLLGYYLTADMKPNTYVSHILKIAYSILWAISRLKSAGVSDDDILLFYTMKIRSVLEYAAPVFTPMLTAKHISDIERIQKIVLKVILGPRYISYHQASLSLSIISLESRRRQLSLNFALACIKSPQHTHLFKERKSTYYQLRNIRSFEEPFCFTKRYSCSPIPFLTRLLNEHFKKNSLDTHAIKKLKI